MGKKHSSWQIWHTLWKSSSSCFCLKNMQQASRRALHRFVLCANCVNSCMRRPFSVTSHLDYCNMHFMGLPLKTYVEVTTDPKCSSVISYGSIHLSLPCNVATPCAALISFRISFQVQIKVLMIIYKDLHGTRQGHL